MNHLEAVRDQFSRAVEGPEDQIDLVEAALLIARTAFPDLDARRYLDCLDQWAARLSRGLKPSPSAGDILSRLNRILFDEEGFSGDHQNYYDPQNSFLNCVIDRKKGIPITLSLIYSEVGRRAGFPLHGYALPGHFIAGLAHVSGTLYVDPFNHGEILTTKECLDMVQTRYGRQASPDSSWKQPAGKKTIIKRMLRNLKGIYRQFNRDLQSLEMLQWILTVDPDAPDELKERGLMYEAMGNSAFALRDLEHYLEVAPASEDRRVVELKVSLLRHSRGWLH